MTSNIYSLSNPKAFFSAIIDQGYDRGYDVPKTALKIVTAIN